MADAKDNNGAGGGAGENPKEKEKVLVKGMGSLALKQPHDDLANLPRVFLKLETTGFGPPVYITQIKAQRGEDAFPACFVKPPKPIEPPASAESDITLVNDQMYFGKERVESVAIGVALEQLLQFLGDQPVVLLGHNIKRYGGHHLLREASDCGMINQLRARIHGFVDTCILFQNYAQNLKSHTLEDLYEHYLSNAELFEPGEEAEALQEIVVAAGISNDTLSEHFFSFAEFESRFLWKRLVFAGVITDYIMKKATRNELHFDTVRQAFAEGGEERAKDVLKQRLTKTRRILDKICRYLRENAEQRSSSQGTGLGQEATG